MATTYTISDLAKEFDLTTRAIRFYEDMGLLQPQRAGPGGRSRVYTPRDRTRLKLTLRAKRLGLSLTEAREIIDMYERKGLTCRKRSDRFQLLQNVLKTLQQARLVQLMRELADMEQQEKELQAIKIDLIERYQGISFFLDRKGAKV